MCTFAGVQSSTAVASLSPLHFTVQPEFLASVIDEMAGLTSEISEELDKTGSTASVTDGVEVAMAVPEVAVVAPEESLESAPVTNGDGKSEEVGGARIT